MKILISAIAFLALLTIVCTHFDVAGIYSEDFGEAFSDPSPWDVVTFAGTEIIALATFSVTGATTFISILLWLAVACIIIPVIYLIRGTS